MAALKRLHELKLLLSNRYVKAEIVRIADGKVVVSASSREIKDSLTSTSDMVAAQRVGEMLVTRAKEADIAAVHYFKPIGKPFHGKLACIVNHWRDQGLAYN
ncbi:hypothetical protein CYMTET_55870 [Cymbomonas tetramitiformis]|uniref:50S ribosomal protein L18 n=1 Tax=Cymbomonas tetramitiformis TaxID=36881 RepID=A0AAE0BD92_9CHLO|nr:hypothetical protein CYMTET_55870 [Cymbomonas tetramitiformis]